MSKIDQTKLKFRNCHFENFRQMTRVYILHHGVFTNFSTKLFQDSHFAFHADSGLSYTGDQATQSYLES
jgi:hypothetical protein